LGPEDRQAHLRADWTDDPGSSRVLEFHAPDFKTRINAVIEMKVRLDTPALKKTARNTRFPAIKI
jgi:hypothetical protein